MARTKQPTPQRREPSSEWMERGKPATTTNGFSSRSARSPENSVANGNDLLKHQSTAATTPLKSNSQNQAGLTELVMCVLGIYISFLLWAFLQERITTTTYGPPAAPEVFTYSVFLNTVQSSFAFVVGYVYLHLSSRTSNSPVPQIFPTPNILPPLLLCAFTNSLASPFGYASLKHVGYITFILAKSCKLLPVMALQVSLFRRRYPFYKYAVVALVTAGVAIFSLNHKGGSKKSAKIYDGASVPWGLMLLAINLLFDGLTNSTQDYINGAFAPYSGSQLMCANNLLSTGLTSTYLLLSPLLSATPLGASVGMTSQAGELYGALAFLTRHREVLWDVLGFAACGAVGQVFIFYTIVKFSSLVLVTVTVTRKMLTMFLSVLWFGHRLTIGQWSGVALVFGGIAAEAAVGKWEKAKKSQGRERKAR